jgi:uncharacterized membrane protein
METRPKIEIESTLVDKTIEALGWLALTILWALPILNYNILPQTIPTHFNAVGNIDAYGSKMTIFLLPLIGSVIFITLTIVNRFAHVFNYPVKITTENAKIQYTVAVRMMRYLKLSLVIIFTFISVWTINAAKGTAHGMGIWMLPLILILIFAPMVYFIRIMLKNK